MEKTMKTKKKLWLIHLLRYLGLSLFVGGIIVIILNSVYSWGVPLGMALLIGLVSIILMSLANTKDFGYATTVDLTGIPVPPLREKGKRYSSDGLIVTITDEKKDENKKD